MREWKDANQSKPEPYALNNLMLESGEVVRGWWTGSGWDGLKVKYSIVVIKYKKCGE